MRGKFTPFFKIPIGQQVWAFREEPDGREDYWEETVLEFRCIHETEASAPSEVLSSSTHAP